MRNRKITVNYHQDFINQTTESNKSQRVTMDHVKFLWGSCWRVLCPQIATALSDGGMAFVEIGAGQGKSVGMLGRDSGLRLLGPFADLSGHERCLQFQKEL